MGQAHFEEEGWGVGGGSKERGGGGNGEQDSDWELGGLSGTGRQHILHNLQTDITLHHTYAGPSLLLLETPTVWL